MKRRFKWWIYTALVIALASCNLPENRGSIPSTGGARTWFDAPLEGMSLELSPYPVVIHSYNPGGTAQLEFSVNGSVLQNLKPSDQAGLSLFEYSWTPPSPGNYSLRARSQSKAGGWDSEAVVNVTVGDFTPTLVPSFTPTDIPTFTPTPVITFTPTKIPSFTPTEIPSYTPTNVPPAELTFQANISTNQIYVGGCGANEVTIQAYASNVSQVKAITLFLKLKDQTTGTSTAWTEGDSMAPAGNGWYQRTVSASAVPGYGDYRKAWLLYQFVATGSGGAIVGRSPVYSDIGVSTCNVIIPVRPTNTPVIIIAPRLIKTATPVIKIPIIR